MNQTAQDVVHFWKDFLGFLVLAIVAMLALSLWLLVWTVIAVWVFPGPQWAGVVVGLTVGIGSVMTWAGVTDARERRSW